MLVWFDWWDILQHCCARFHLAWQHELWRYPCSCQNPIISSRLVPTSTMNQAQERRRLRQGEGNVLALYDLWRRAIRIYLGLERWMRRRGRYIWTCFSDSVPEIECAGTFLDNRLRQLDSSCRFPYTYHSRINTALLPCSQVLFDVKAGIPYAAISTPDFINDFLWVFQEVLNKYYFELVTRDVGR